MHVLPLPGDDAQGVYDTCISRVANRALKARLVAARATVMAAGTSFEGHAAATSIYQIVAHDLVASVTKKEMVAVYEQRMVGQKSPGRAVYDRLMAIPPLGRCPLCGVGVVATLDHFLPKRKFPSLAVVPANLIATCRNCNDEKDETRPMSADDQLLHPYFDNVEGFRWLRASVVIGSPASLTFYVDPSDAPSTVLAARLENHFATLKLARLYASNAGDQISELVDRLRKLHRASGFDGVRRHLEEEHQTCAAARLNQWRTATFEALAASDWYCDGGFGE